MTETKIIDPSTKTILEKIARRCIADAKDIGEARKWFLANVSDHFDHDDYNDSEWAEVLKERNAIFAEAIRAMDNTIDHPEDCEGDLTEFERG